MVTGNKVFEVASTLDMSGITDEDLKDTVGASNQKLLREKGVYNLTIDEVKILEGKVDGAGKKWGTAYIKATNPENNGLQKIFLDYPIDSAVHTSANGKTSTIKTKIFASAMSSITGTDVRTADLPSVVASLESLLVPGATFRASLDYKSDHITRQKSGDFVLFTIVLGNGDLMTDGNGDQVSFDNYDAASNYYTQVTGRKIRTGMDVVSFLRKVSAAIKAVA